MGRFDLDFEHVERVVTPDGRVPLRGNEHRLTRVAYDMFRMDNEPETLWKVQSDDDGNEFLVRTYSLPDEELSAQSSWSVAADSKKTNLTVAYKGVPIHRLVAADYGAASPRDTDLLASVLRRKLATDGEFAGKLLGSLPAAKLRAVAASFPELSVQAHCGSCGVPADDDELAFEDDDRHTRPTVEVPMLDVKERHTRPTAEVPMLDVKERHTRPTAEHFILPPGGSEEKKKEFLASPAFEEAFKAWLGQEEGVASPALGDLFKVPGGEE